MTTIKTRHAADGIILYHTQIAESDDETVPAILERQARERGDQNALIDARSGVQLTYNDLWDRTKRLAQNLGQFDLGVDQPIAILSENSIDHAIVMFAGMVRGVPVAPLSVAYSQFSDLSRISTLFGQLTPGLVFAEDANSFARSLAKAADLNIPTMASHGAGANHILSDCLDEAMENTQPAQVDGDTIAKILFTSGSTGDPKGVIVTQRMICSNQTALSVEWPFLAEEPPTIVDWLPWNHVYGGNLVLMCALRNGGTLIIDHGRPLPGQFAQTVENLATYRPTIHFGVPRGFDQLTQELEADEDFARAYFSRLRRMFTAGAALPSAIWDRYRRLATRYAQDDFVTHVAWGATETSPVVTLSPAENTRPDNLGLPIQGCELKMVPNEDRYDLRLRGPMVTPGYWRNQPATDAAFDSDGFYKIGDAGRLIDDDPTQGIVFEGRISENFKLATGTWVQVNALRLATINALRPVVQDVVVAGHDRNEVGVLLFMNRDGCCKITGDSDSSLIELTKNDSLRTHLAKGLSEVGKDRGSAGRVARGFVLIDSPSQEDGEMTDKGYINQRAALRKRADAVTQLFEDAAHPNVILAAG
ncbi:MAG: AMP-binding protein [Aestuariivita sp.]|nr:AMP-binding protein [Aestuariivita sp.]MCY4203410.1 AMP-binding protein [Aestuariivita sp.]MCY4288338.1 AMP-binding protein [Aestuariivita sp.]MCY4345664.1 AMP-binding protein [Aestuariivita sp.]